MSERPAWPAPRLAVALGVVAALVTIALLQTRLAPVGVSGQWNWEWRLEAPALGPLSLLALLLMVALAGLTALTLRDAAEPRRALTAGLLALSIAGSGLWMVGPMLDDGGQSMLATVTTLGRSSGGYYTYAATTPSFTASLQHYATRRVPVDMPSRMQTHPPGPYLAAHAVCAFVRAWPGAGAALEGVLNSRFRLRSADILPVAVSYSGPGLQAADIPGAWLYALLSTLSGAALPLVVYALALAVGDRRAALLAAALAATIPSLLVFVPSIDGTAAVLAVLPLALYAWALRRGSLLLAVLTGLAATAALLWSTGLAVAIGPLVGLGVAHWRTAAEDRRQAGREALRLVLTAAGVALLGLVLYGVLTGYNYLRDFAVMSHAHRVESSGRTYSLYLLANLWDVVLFMGPALAVLAALAARHWRAQAPGLLGVSAGIWIALGLTWLSGFTRGEVGRIWLFGMPLLALAAASWLAARPGKATAQAVALVLVCQLAVALNLAQTLNLVHP